MGRCYRTCSAQFGLSLLVPEGQYRRVSNYVDKTDLKGRLVYYRVPDDTKLSARKIPENYLCHKDRN